MSQRKMEADGVFPMNGSQWRHPGTLISHKLKQQVVPLQLKSREAGLLPEAMGTTSQVNLGENEVLQVRENGNLFDRFQNR